MLAPAPISTAAATELPEVRADSPKDDEKILATARKRFGEALEASTENRDSYIKDVRFSSTDDQWDAGVKKRRGADRPALTFNRLEPVIQQIIGEYRQNKLSIKVLPASGEASEDTADILAGLIRNIEMQSRADVAYVTALECSARGGFGYFRVITDYTADDVFEQDILIRPIANPLTVYLDPSARMPTKEDARWGFVTETIPKDEFEDLYPDAVESSFDALDDADQLAWNGPDGVRIAEYYEKVTYACRLGLFSNGMVIDITDESEIEALAHIGVTLTRERQADRSKIIWRKMTGTKVLDTREYKARYIPIIYVPGKEVNIEGKTLTRSAIYFSKDAQRVYNFSKSTGIEAVALSPKTPYKLTPTQIENHEEQWGNINNVPTPYILYNPDPAAAGAPQREQPATQPIAEMSLALGAADDIKATSTFHDASLGAQGNEISGVAIEARQNQGNNGTYTFHDNLKMAIEQCGRVLIDMIPSIYDTERVVRILDLEGKPSNETINEQKYDPMTGVVTVLNSLAVGKYDAIVEAGPSFSIRRREGVAGMLKLAQIDPTFMPKAGDLFIKNMDFPGADEIAARYERSMPPQLTVDPDSPEGKQMQAQMAKQQAAQQNMQQQALQSHVQTAQAKQQGDMAKSQAQMAKANAEMVKASSDVIEAKLGVVKSANDLHADHANRVWDVAKHAANVLHTPQTRGVPNANPQLPAA